MKLSDKACKTARIRDKAYKLSDGGGLYLLVKPNGNKHWRLKYYFLGREKLLALGPYPLVPLAEARDGREAAKKLLLKGTDPIKHKDHVRRTKIRDAKNTFKVVALEWYENRKHMWTPEYAEEILKRLEADIFPALGNYAMNEIEPPLLLDVIRKIENRGALEIARRQVQKCGEIFRYAIACGKAVRDPSADIKEALKPIKTEHYAAIDVHELPDLVQAIEKNDARLYQSTRNALKLMMLTFVRTGELINARWTEMDFERQEWVIPAERMKMRKEHIVPLSRQALAVLESQKEIAGHRPFVFPSAVKPRKSMSNNTLLVALKRLGYGGRMTGHGFRALAMSAIKQELGYRHEVVDRQLAHVHKSKIDQAYDRALFLEERKVMMQAWADYIDALAKKEPINKG